MADAVNDLVKKLAKLGYTCFLVKGAPAGAVAAKVEDEEESTEGDTEEEGESDGEVDADTETGDETEKEEKSEESDGEFSLEDDDEAKEADEDNEDEGEDEEEVAEDDSIDVGDTVYVVLEVEGKETETAGIVKKISKTGKKLRVAFDEHGDLEVPVEEATLKPRKSKKAGKPAKEEKADDESDDDKDFEKGDAVLLKKGDKKLKATIIGKRSDGSYNVKLANGDRTVAKASIISSAGGDDEDEPAEDEDAAAEPDESEEGETVEPEEDEETSDLDALVEDGQLPETLVVKLKAIGLDSVAAVKKAAKGKAETLVKAKIIPRAIEKIKAAVGLE